MANQEHLALLKQGVEVWNEWREKNPEIRLDLRWADLIEANLSGVQALGTNFEGAIFTGACIENWNINSENNLNDTICDYIYLKQNQAESKTLSWHLRRFCSNGAVGECDSPTVSIAVSTPI